MAVGHASGAGSLPASPKTKEKIMVSVGLRGRRPRRSATASWCSAACIADEALARTAERGKIQDDTLRVQSAGRGER
jgi:hypothetical protein